MKKKSKFMLAVLVVTSMFFFSACGGEETVELPSEPDKQVDVGSEEADVDIVAEEGAVIKFTYWAGSPSDEAAWELMLNGFREDHPEIQLEAEAYPSETYNSQLDTMIAGNTWPDVMRYTYQRVGKFKEADVMLDIGSLVSQETVDDLLPAYKEAMSYEGKLLGMPHHTDTMALYYNKEMFEESGIRIPTGPTDGWSWEEMGEIARKLKADHQLENAFAAIWENKNAYRFFPFIYMNNGALLNEDGTQVTLNTPEFLEALELYEGWVKEGLITKSGFTQPNQANSMFVAKQLAFVFAGSWHCTYMQENMPDNWGVTYMPQVDGKSGSDMGGNGLFAYKGTKYPKASAIFIDYLTKKENMKSFCETGMFIPVSKSLSEESLNFAEFNDEMNTFMEITTTIDPKMASDETSSRFQELNIIFGEEMDYLAMDGASPEDVINKLEVRMQEVLDE